jgi:hypothetical protein
LEAKRPLLASVLILAAICSACKARDFDAKNRCVDRGQAYLAHERSVYGADVDVGNEQFTFNKSLNTCPVYFEVIEPKVGISSNIVDTLSNRKLYYHVSFHDQKMQHTNDELCKPEDGCLSLNGLLKKRDELFKQ